jgi:hypothetical protein
MENIITHEDLPEFIRKTLVAVRDGVALTRESNILADLPKEVQFNVTVIGRWQASDLAVISTDTSTGKDNSKGLDHSVSSDTSKGKDVSTGTDHSESVDKSSGTDTSTSTDASNSTDTSQGSDSDQTSAYGYNKK